MWLHAKWLPRGDAYCCSFLISLLCLLVVSHVMSMRSFVLVLVDGQSKGALLLDGSDPGLYYSAGRGSDANKWLLYFEGGGWSYTESDSAARAQTPLGSSRSWPKTLSSWGGGMMDTSCATNPYFCKWSMVVFKYGDAFSFSGNRTDPIMVHGQPIFFRGARVLDALIEAAAGLSASTPLLQASRVVLSGCSAGAASAFIHADYVRDKLLLMGGRPSDYRVVPISGIFLDAPSVTGASVYADQMRAAFAMQNASGGRLNSACLAANVGAEWKCSFAHHNYGAHISSPVFVLNSLYDSWAIPCILAAEPAASGAAGNCSAAPGWAACGWNPGACDAGQLASYRAYGKTFASTLSATAAYSKPGNGGFLGSCVLHCEAQQRAWKELEIGGISMRDAVAAWMEAPVTSPPAWHVDCEMGSVPGATMCNPTC
jgi:STAM-binding protein